ncbi:hypothetical protein PIB30_034413 [Stylosanthes scabra]|uniref:Uncharacterized protein n=1 Tax=Stylosanthes scabra TaxID=79078 RepID=A0ABU6QCE3_9FABA|nr:hypothetical protein [Stylosanthes scabra]
MEDVGGLGCRCRRCHRHNREQRERESSDEQKRGMEKGVTVNEGGVLVTAKHSSLPRAARRCHGLEASGILLFRDLKTTLEKKGLVLVNPLAEVIEKPKRVDEANDFIPTQNLFLTVGEAVALLSI